MMRKSGDRFCCYQLTSTPRGEQDMLIVHKKLHLLLLVVLACVFDAYASEIHGVITDPLGAVISNAKVTLHSGTQILGSTVTGSAGQYSFSVKRAGRVRISAEAETFALAETEAFYVTGGNETVTRNLLLGIKSASEQVVVSATGVPTAEAQVGASVSVLTPEWYLAKLDVLDPLHLVPGLQLTQRVSTEARQLFSFAVEIPTRTKSSSMAFR